MNVGSRVVKVTLRWGQLLPEVAFGASKCEPHREEQKETKGPVWPPAALTALASAGPVTLTTGTCVCHHRP